MNTYEISIQRENGTTCTDRVVAATPAEAKKLFREIYRHGEAFQSKDLKVELVAENVPASKDQELEALERIKAIVESLGPDSYVGTAFEGCFEIAEDNIGNDFACSMKQRVEAVVVENSRLKEKVKELEEKLAESKKNYEGVRSFSREVVAEKDAEISRLKALALSDDDLTDCIQMAREAAYGYLLEMEKAAASVVELAEDPTSPEFVQAVKDHRNAKTSKEYAEGLADRLTEKQKNLAGA
ncbi:hypothetical protein [Muriventricola aceti]|uniref:hypothetical protein n=1 Tax=Muriventricola aceti TaxID=2981773 RepID=UPI000820EEAE|nr:hypothetical protein [Muriventricola aceti]MCU6701276.1 hypothetical protein [Muriventricola aceti]SCI56254.1 Uncharacterised protein [uncultured Flavonifractor sp.]